VKGKGGKKAPRMRTLPIVKECGKMDERSKEIDVKSVTEITLNELLNEPTSKNSGNSTKLPKTKPSFK
jgi:hypothetical protein